MRNADLREEIDGLIESGGFREAHAALVRLWKDAGGPALAPFVIARFESVRHKIPVVSCRVAILRSFTVEPVMPVLRAAAAVKGLDVAVHVGEFNAYAQEILAEESPLYRFEPDIVILAVQTRDVAPELWRDFADLSPADTAATAERVGETFRSLVKAFRSHSKAHLVVHTFEQPIAPSHGVLDGQGEGGQADAIRRINLDLRRLAQEHRGVYVLDYDALVARHGRLAWQDERKWLTMRMPIAAQCLVHLANEWIRFIHPLTGKVCKALVVDLDNTLWGGVIGEDGMGGIALSPEYSGAAFQALQRVILDLYHRGIILAVCSKNNPADAMEALEKHPGMVLRPEHFAALRINWNDKAQTLREIAAELNIGTDALAFLDDNPAEREWVRQQLPGVTVIDLPEDPMAYARALRETPAFERLTLSAEDRERGRYYAEERLRSELQAKADSLEHFYRSLEMEAEIALVTPETQGRVAQLTQKTNQFNLTTRRYSEQQIAELAADTAWRVYSLQLKDRFGDNGLVGVAITHIRDGACEIDTFLMSCRVIGRTAETAFLATVAEEARSRGAVRLVGWFCPTRKNAPAKDFYPSHGFDCAETMAEGSRWEFDMGQEGIAPPPWIKRRVQTKGKA
jgi:FkbH-like protein